MEWLPTITEQAFDLGAAFLREAIRRSQQDVARHPESARAHTNLAQAFWQAGDMDAAAAHCESAFGIEREDYVASLLLARVREVQGRSEDARTLYEGVCGRHPSDAAALIGLANAEIRRGDFKGAIEHLRRVAELEPTATVPRFYLGMALLRVGRSNEAITHFKAAARIDLRSPVLHCALGLAYWSQGAQGRAEQRFKTAVHVLPAYAPAVRSLAHLLILQKRIQEAIPVLETYLATNPDSDAARDLLGWALFEKGDYRHSIEQLKMVSTLMERAQRNEREIARVANNIGVCYSRLRDRKNGETWYLRAIVLDGGQVEGHQNLARLYLAVGNPDPAVQVLTRFREVKPDDPETTFLLALAKNNLGETNEAITELRSLVQRDDARPAAFSFLGSLLADEVDAADQAVSILQEGYRRFPKDAGIVNNLAYALLLANSTAEARSVLEQYPEPSVRDVYLRATWGLLHLREGHLEQGIQGYTAAQELAQSLGQRDLSRQTRQKMHLELARAYLWKGEVEVAAKEVAFGLGIAGKPAYERLLREIQRSLPDRT